MPEIRTIEDVRAFEQTPLSEHPLAPNTYAALAQSAAAHPDRKALSFFLQAKGESYQDAEVYTYRDLLGNINQTANMFRSLGIGDKDVVSFVLPNLPETHWTIWGGETAGIVNPINPLLEPDAIKEILQAAECKVLVTIAPFPNTDLWQKIDAIRGDIPSLETILVIRLEDHLKGFKKLAVRLMMGGKRRYRNVGKQQVLDFNTYRSGFPTERLTFQRDIQPEDIASYFHTGGTTGTPKLAMHTHRNEVYDAWAMMQASGLATGERNFFCGLPLFHVNGVLVTGLGPWAGGSHIVLGTPQGYRGEGLLPNFWKIVDHYQLNFFSGVPTVYAYLLNVPIAGSDISSLEYAICGAAPMPVEVFRNFEKKTGVNILEGYGCTEGTCASAVNPSHGERRIGSIGFSLPYQEMKILVLDDEGKFERVAETDEIGIVAIRGENVFPGYKDEVHNRNIWIDTGDGNGPFYNTGDMGRQDAESYFWLTGRKKEIIIRGGHNIDPQLIEGPLTEHPKVEMAAAVGRPDPKVGEVPVAYIQLVEGESITKEEILSFALEHIKEKAAIPKHIHVVDQLPVTAVGKIFKPTLAMREIQEVFEQELKQFTGIDDSAVEVVPDKIHGRLAKLHISAREGDDPEAIKRQLDKVLGAYAVKYEISVTN